MGLRHEEAVGDVDETLCALKRLRAQRKSNGEDITEEWRGLVAEHGLPAVEEVLKRMAPRDRWPNRTEEKILALRAEASMPAHTADPWQTDPDLRAADAILRAIGVDAAASAIGMPSGTEQRLRAALAGDPDLIAKLIATTTAKDPA